MKNKAVVCIIIFLIINILCINMSYADYLSGGSSTETTPYAPGLENNKNDEEKSSQSTSTNSSGEYYEFPNGVKIQKDKVKNNNNQDEIKQIANELMSVDIDECDSKELVDFNEALENFYYSYKNLKEKDKPEYYNKLYEFSFEGTYKQINEQIEEGNDLSVSERIFERAYHFLYEDNPKTGTGYGITANSTQRDRYFELIDVMDRRRDEIYDNKGIQPPSSAAAGQGGNATDVETDEKAAEEDNQIYYAPDKIGSLDSSGENLDDVINDAEDFVNSGEASGIGTVNQTNLQKFSGTLYNILLAIGVAVAVIVGAILGIKLMVSSVEEKAEVKGLIIPYIAGCIIVFGGFTIWKVVVEILSTL